MGIIQPSQPQDAKLRHEIGHMGVKIHTKKFTYEVFERGDNKWRKKKQNRSASSRIHRSKKRKNQGYAEIDREAEAYQDKDLADR